MRRPKEPVLGVHYTASASADAVNKRQYLTWIKGEPF
jgi:hypothetical protein